MLHKDSDRLIQHFSYLKDEIEYQNNFLINESVINASSTFLYAIDNNNNCFMADFKYRYFIQ